MGETGHADQTTIYLPNNIIANNDFYFQAMALTNYWQPMDAKIFCNIANGTNKVAIRTSKTLSSNVLLADIMLPRYLFAIT